MQFIKKPNILEHVYKSENYTWVKKEKRSMKSWKNDKNVGFEDNACWSEVYIPRNINVYI